MLSRTARISFFIGALVHILFCAGCLYLIPLQISLALGCLAGIYVATFALFGATVLSDSRWAPLCGRVAAGVSIFCFFVLLVRVGFWVVYLQALYRELGLAMAVGIGIIALGVGFLLVTFPCVILAYLSGRFGRSLRLAEESQSDDRQAKKGSSQALTTTMVLGALVAAFFFVQIVELSAASASPWSNLQTFHKGQLYSSELGEQLSEGLQGALAKKKSFPGRRELSSVRPYQCESPVTEVAETWLIQFEGAAPKKLAKKKGVRLPGPLLQYCLQGESREQLQAELLTLAQQKLRGRRIKVDTIEESRKIPAASGLIQALAMRPGLDAVCVAGKCLAPWQHIVRDDFNTYHPLPPVKDARAGVDWERLLKAVGVKRADGDKVEAPVTLPASLRVVTGESYLLTLRPVKGSPWTVKSVRLRRLLPPAQPLEKEAVQKTVRSALSYIHHAQGKDGIFRYSLNPFTGKTASSGLNLPRHAGTTLAFCEWSKPDRSSRRVVRLALQALRKMQRHSPMSREQGSGVQGSVEQGQSPSSSSEEKLAYLVNARGTANLGYTALPMIALLECAKRGYPVPEFDLAGVARFLKVMQRENGSFYRYFDRKTLEPMGEGESLYAAGQAVYALFLLSEVAQSGDIPGLDAALIAAAARRATAYYGGDYWGKGPEDFFYYEENWHCLAARAAPDDLRDQRYEEFCIDYVGFKARLLESASSTQDWVGGFTASPVFPPHSTPTAGIAEAGSAAIFLAQRLGQDAQQLKASVRLAMSYLQRVQLKKENCFACRGKRAYGGFPESPTSAQVRIDYVQHCMAGLAHGAEMVFEES
ncbi:MAG: hypothetical protein MK135_11930 [Polyangiaceae bacterium]|nr:hypothetical protein [Polyangiaceae bacterium]